MRTSAFPDGTIRCPATGCGAMKTTGSGRETDDQDVTLLRLAGWQVFAGAWTCPQHLPANRQGRGIRNPHCTKCGDLRGGPYGHQAYECGWR
jgi:hypothetical protein